MGVCGPVVMGFDDLASSLSDFQRVMRCVAGRMAARRGAQPMAPPLASVATQQTPSSRATRRAGRPFGGSELENYVEMPKDDPNDHRS
jgi:hypothetical protein